MIKNNFKIDSLNPSDAINFHQFITNNYEHLKYYFPKTLADNSTFEKTKEYLVLKQKERLEKSNFLFLIREIDTDKIAGLIIIKKIDWSINQAELAYCVGSEFEGKGVTSFAVAEIIKFCFAELHLKILQIIAHKSNFASCKVALKNNFIWQRILKNEFTPTNELPLDMELYEFSNNSKLK